MRDRSKLLSDQEGLDGVDRDLLFAVGGQNGGAGRCRGRFGRPGHIGDRHLPDLGDAGRVQPRANNHEDRVEHD